MSKKDNFEPVLELLDSEAMKRLKEQFERRAERCRNKNYNEEGIPMFLVLEDVGCDASGAARTGVISGDPMYNLMLAAMLEVFSSHLANQDRALEPKEISIMLEVLADQYFALANPPNSEPTPH